MIWAPISTRFRQDFDEAMILAPSISYYSSVYDYVLRLRKKKLCEPRDKCVLTVWDSSASPPIAFAPSLLQLAVVVAKSIKHTSR